MLSWLAFTAATEAAPYRTGHHHAEFDWYTIDTRFFRVHYPVSSSGVFVDSSRTATEVAQVADELLLLLGAETETVWKSPIHIVVSDEAEGMTAYTLPHWRFVVLSSDPGVDVMRLRGRPAEGWITEALAHELGHVIGHRRASPFAPSASYGIEGSSMLEFGRLGIGAGFVLGPNEPYGWSEGAAEFWSNRIGVATPSAGRMATLRTSLLSGRALEWDEWLVSDDKGDLLDAERAYQQGYAYAAWLAQRYGRDIFLDVARSASLRYPLSWSSRFRRATGLPARVSWGQWRASAYADAAAELARRRVSGLTEGRELERWTGSWTSTDLAATDRWLSRSGRDREEARESTGSFELYPRASADGRWLAEGKVGWVHVWRGAPIDWSLPGDSDRARLAQRDALGDRTSVWIPASFGSPPSFVPGRDAMVIVAPEDVRRPVYAPHPRDPYNQLYLVNLTPQSRTLPHRGGEIAVESLQWSARAARERMTPIAGTQRARDPSVSPDGQTLAFLSYRDGTTNLVVSSLEGTARRALSSFDNGEWLQHPSWSPDGRSLVVSVMAEQGDLWIVDVASGRWSQLTDSPEDEIDAVWAADGIWFVSEVDGVNEILRLDPQDGSVLQQTRTLGGVHTPWVLPGGHLLYTASTAFGWKAMFLPASEQLALPLPNRTAKIAAPSDGVLTSRAEESTWLPRAYRSWRSLLVPAVSPMFRIDGSAERVRPLAGAYLHVRDAIERFDLQSYGLIGEDVDGSTILTWRGLPPELSFVASGSLDASSIASDSGLPSFGSVGLDMVFRLQDAVSFGLSAERWATSDEEGPRVRSYRVHGRLMLGEPPPRGVSRGLWSTLSSMHARSEVDAGIINWNRLAFLFAGITPMWSTGPLSEHRNRIEWSLFAGATDRSVSEDEQLYAGGDIPGALRLGFGPSSVPLPGTSPYTIGSGTLGVARATWILPVAPRLRTVLGPLYLQNIELGAGAGCAGTDQGEAIGEVIAEMRFGARLFDAPWDGVVRTAFSAGDPGVSPLRERLQGPVLGPRVMIGLGTGF